MHIILHHVDVAAPFTRARPRGDVSVLALVKDVLHPMRSSFWGFAGKWCLRACRSFWFGAAMSWPRLAAVLDFRFRVFEVRSRSADFDFIQQAG